MRRWPSANISTYFFLGSDMKNIVSSAKKIFCWLNSAFPFILSVILYLWIRIRIQIRNPDPDPRTQMYPDPTGSGSTSLEFLKEKKKLRNSLKVIKISLAMFSYLCSTSVAIIFKDDLSTI